MNVYGKCMQLRNSNKMSNKREIKLIKNYECTPLKNSKYELKVFTYVEVTVIKVMNVRGIHQCRNTW